MIMSELVLLYLSVEGKAGDAQFLGCVGHVSSAFAYGTLDGTPFDALKVEFAVVLRSCVVRSS